MSRALYICDRLAASGLESLVWARVSISGHPFPDSIELIHEAVYQEARLYTVGMQIEQEAIRD